jgi:VWFA-related protein
MRGGAGTTLYDAVYLSANEVTKKEKGRKALIILTDGVDQGSKVFLNDAIEAAQRADTLVYSILFADEQGYGGRGGPDPKDGKRVLERMSRETGGSFFEVTKKLSIDDIYGQIEQELRNQYSLGYSSDNAGGGVAYRSIKVTVRKPGLTVQTREGYYPIS